MKEVTIFGVTHKITKFPRKKKKALQKKFGVFQNKHSFAKKVAEQIQRARSVDDTKKVILIN